MPNAAFVYTHLSTSLWNNLNLVCAVLALTNCRSINWTRTREVTPFVSRTFIFRFSQFESQYIYILVVWLVTNVTCFSIITTKFWKSIFMDRGHLHLLHRHLCSLIGRQLCIPKSNLSIRRRRRVARKMRFVKLSLSPRAKIIAYRYKGQCFAVFLDNFFQSNPSWKHNVPRRVAYSKIQGFLPVLLHNNVSVGKGCRGTNQGKHIELTVKTKDSIHSQTSIHLT